MWLTSIFAGAVESSDEPCGPIRSNSSLAAGTQSERPTDGRYRKILFYHLGNLDDIVADPREG